MAGIDIASLSIELNTSGVKQGADSAVRDLGRVKQATTEAVVPLGAASGAFQKMGEDAAKATALTAQQVTAATSKLKSMGLAGEELARALRAMGVAQDQFGGSTSKSLPGIQAISGAFRQLGQEVAKNQAIAAGGAAVSNAYRQMAQEIAKAAAASTAHTGAVKREVDMLRGLAIQAKAAGDQEERLAALRSRLAGATVGGRIPLPSPAASNASAAGLRRVQSATQVLAFSLAGIPGPVGRVASSLGMFALGGAVTVAVVAGVAAIAFAIAKLTEPMRKAREELKKLLDEAKELRAEQFRTPAILVDQAVRERAKIQAQFEREQRGRTLESAQGAVIGTIVDQKEVARLESVLKDLDALIAKRRQLANVVSVHQQNEIANLTTIIGLGKATTGDLQRAAEVRTALVAILATENLYLGARLQFTQQLAALDAAGDARVKARQQQVAALTTARLETAVTRSKLLGTIAEQEAAMRAKVVDEIERQVRAQDRLSTQEQERLRAILLYKVRLEEITRVLERQPRIIDAMAKLMDQAAAAEATRRKKLLEDLDAARLFDQIAARTGLFTPGATRNPSLRPAPRPTGALAERVIGSQKTPQQIAQDFADEQDRLAAVGNRVWENALRNFQETFASGFRDVFRDGINGFEAFADQVADIMENLASQIASVFVTKGLGIDKLLAELSKGTSLQSALGKLSGGQRAGLAGVAGFGIGQATGSAGIGALGGAAAGFAVGGPIGGIIGGVSGLVGGLLGSSAKAKQAAEEMRKAQKAFAEALDDFVAIAHPRGILGDALKGLEKQARDLQEAAFAAAGGIDKARKSALGRGDVVTTSQDAIQAELARLEALKETNSMAWASSASARAYLEKLLEIRKAFDENIKAITEQIALEQKRLGEDLTVRGLRAQGLNAEADALAFANAQQREYAELLKSMGPTLNQALLDQLKYTQAIEAEARVKEAAQKQADLSADLEVRRLAATGDVRAAEDLRQALEQEREMREAVQNGISDLNRALLEQVQALEAATAAERRRRAELEAGQDLDVRFLRALGQDRAAEELQFTVGQARERQGFAEQGFGEDFLKRLEEVQAAERARFLGQFQEAADSAVAAAASPSVRDITGITETTGVRLDSRLFTTNVILRQIEQNTRGGRQAQRVVVLQAPADADPDAIVEYVDRIGGQNLNLQNSAAGVAPTV